MDHTDRSAVPATVQIAPASPRASTVRQTGDLLRAAPT